MKATKQPYGGKVYKFTDGIHGGEYAISTFPRREATLTRIGGAWPARYLDRTAAAAIILQIRRSNRPHLTASHT